MKQNFILLTLISLTTIISCVEKDSINLPEACFNITPKEGKAGDEIQFTNCSKNATHFVWTFGDGESSTQREPLHVYRKKGNYEVRLLAGEDKNNDGILNLLDEPDSTFQIIEISQNHLAVELTIYSASSWTLENPVLSVVPNATIFLYKEYSTSLDLEKPDYTFTSDENGKILFYDEEVEAVCFIVKKDDESNIINDYIIGGVFQSQEDIDYSAFQDGAEIGGLKFADMNGDGVITEFDKAPYQSISISPNETFKLDVIIGKQKSS